MTLPAVAAVPNPTSPTFGIDAYAFTLWMAAFAAALPAEIDRINALGFGSYTTTSTTSLTIATGAKTLTVEAGKGFTIGQPVVIAQTSTPTNYMTGQVASYNATTGALVVGVTATGGSGTAVAWTVSVSSIVAGGGVSPDSIVVLTSGTSWPCPAGVTRIKLRAVGAGAGHYTTSSTPSSAASSGAYIEQILPVTPGTAYAYSIGAPGAIAAPEGVKPGGDTTFTANGVTYTAQGGKDQLYLDSYTSNAQLTILSNRSLGSGSFTTGPGSPLGVGGNGIMSLAAGYGGGNVKGSGGQGAIVLELYK